MPPLVMVKVPPCRSASVSLSVRAFCPSSAICFSSSAIDSWSASRTTGTTSPRLPDTATPMS